MKLGCDANKSNYLKVSLTELKFMRLSPDMLIGYDRWGKAWSCAMFLDLRKKTIKPLQCQDCDIDVRFLASVRFKRMFRSTITKRKFFLCPNCGRLTSAFVAIYEHPRSVAMSGGSTAGITPRPHLTRHGF